MYIRLCVSQVLSLIHILNDVLREQIQLNTKEVVVNVDNDHMKASIVLNGIGSDEAYTYEEIAEMCIRDSPDTA